MLLTDYLIYTILKLILDLQNHCKLESLIIIWYRLWIVWHLPSSSVNFSISNEDLLENTNKMSILSVVNLYSVLKNCRSCQLTIETSLHSQTNQRNSNFQHSPLITSKMVSICTFQYRKGISKKPALDMPPFFCYSQN